MFYVYLNPGVSRISFQVTVNKTAPDNSGLFIFCADDNAYVQSGYLMVNDSINITGTLNQLVLGSNISATINAVAPAVSQIYTISDTGDNSNFIMSASN